MSAMKCEFAARTVTFLGAIGLQIEVVPGARGFLEHIEIRNGGLRVDPEAAASNLLHEAGHLAIVPKRFRSYLNGDLAQGMEKIFRDLEEGAVEADSDLARAMMQTGDTEATAWAWAAGKSICLPEDQIIQASEYSGDGAGIRFMLSSNAYVGIHGISHAGFCVPRHNPYRQLPVYPKLAFWLQV